MLSATQARGRRFEARIQERLRGSKNAVIILSADTRKSGSMLSYEIEQALDVYGLPLIITYVDFQVVLQPHLLSKNTLTKTCDNQRQNKKNIRFLIEKKPIIKYSQYKNKPGKASIKKTYQKIYQKHRRKPHTFLYPHMSAFALQ